jgi:hypothetical protein
VTQAATWPVGAEERLILHACRSTFAATTTDAPAGAEPRRAIDLAQRLGVVGLVSSWSRALPGADARWHRAWLANLTRNLATVDELEHWRDILRAKGIEVVVFKGPALAARAFGGLHRRDWGDLDIIVPPAAFPTAYATLVEHGAMPMWEGPAPTHDWVEGRGITFTVSERDGRLLLDLHAGWRPLWGAIPDGKLTDGSLVDVDIGGVHFRTLNAELTAIHAACHFVQHGYTLKTLVDVVAALARVRAEGRLEALRERARTMRLGRTLDVATAAADEFLEQGRAPSLRADLGTPTVLTDPARPLRFDLGTWLETRRPLGHGALLRDAVRTIWLPRGYVPMTPEWIDPRRIRLRRLSRIARLATTALPTIGVSLRTIRRRAAKRTATDARGALADRAVAVTIGAAAGIAAGLALTTGSPAAAGGAVVLVAGVLGVVRLIAPHAERGDLAKIAAFAVTLRLAAAAVLYVGAIAAGKGGFITGDDRGYSQVAWGYAQWLHGTPFAPYVPPGWGGDASLLGTFTYLTSAVYYAFGFQPLLVSFINAAAVTVAMLLVWDIGRGIFGPKPAAVAIVLLALDPANIVFSALHLKDSLSLLIVAAVIWSIIRFQAHPTFHRLAAAAVGIALMYSIRSYLSFVLLGVALFGSLLPRGASRWGRLTWSASAAIACGGALAVGLLVGTTSLPTVSFASFEQIRIAMAHGANTAFSVDPTPGPALGSAVVPSRGGAVDTSFGEPVIAPVTLEQTPLPAMVAGLRILGTCLFVAWVVSRSAGRRAVPLAAISAIVVAGLWLAATSVGAGAGRLLDADALLRTIGYLPRGLSNLFFAPYPWGIRRVMDLPAIPAMLGWYAILGAALWVVARRRMVVPTATVLLFAATMFVLLLLTEGNVGTLFRHRAMTAAPFVTLLAAPALLQLWSWVGRRWADARRPIHPGATSSSRR